MIALYAIGYLIAGFALVCGCRFFGVHPIAFEDWDEPMDDDNISNGYIALFWPAFLALWIGKLLLWWPIAGGSYLIGAAITRCRMCRHD
ncbi:MAG TPA: hypothetical protein VIU44_07945 [Gaiellaceae bacterium]